MECYLISDHRLDVYLSKMDSISDQFLDLCLRIRWTSNLKKKLILPLLKGISIWNQMKIYWSFLNGLVTRDLRKSMIVSILFEVKCLGHVIPPLLVSATSHLSSPLLDFNHNNLFSRDCWFWRKNWGLGKWHWCK